MYIHTYVQLFVVKFPNLPEFAQSRHDLFWDAAAR